MDVTVLPFALPDNLNFIVDLNAYGGVNSGYDIARGTPEYRKLLQAYHRVAHLNRANLDVLGYSHSGNHRARPDSAAHRRRRRTRVPSWADWDAHFGPLVPARHSLIFRAPSVPVPIIYLAIVRKLAGDLRKTYKWNIPDIRNQGRVPATHRAPCARSGPIEEGFPREYQDRFSAVAREFAEHIRGAELEEDQVPDLLQRQVLLQGPHPQSRGGGVSWWLLDEPNHHDDYRALSFFGWLGKRWLKELPDVPMVFRADISYVDFIRDQLAGQIDIDCTSQHFFTKNRYLMDNRNRFGRTYWNTPQRTTRARPT